MDAEKRSDILRNAGFAFVVDHPLDVETWVKGDWLLDAIKKLDGDDPDGANAEAYAEGQNAAALVGEQLVGERSKIWQDTSISWSVRIDRLEATGLDINAIIAIAMLGGGAGKGPVYKTNSEAKIAANALGFVKINDTTHGGQPVFKKGNLYITRDLDGHNGGAWKMATSIKNLGSKATRLGTYDTNLNRIGD
ncbi:hypothetical protein HU757_10630 [Rhizobium laguerreae]|nr:hypothetical protein [Rhizobium laguerreae]